MADFKFKVATSSKDTTKRKSRVNSQRKSETVKAVIVYIGGITCAKVLESELCYPLDDVSRSIEGRKVIYVGMYSVEHVSISDEPSRVKHATCRHRYRKDMKVMGFVTVNDKFHITKLNHG